MVAHDIGRIAVRRLPENLAFGEADRTDQAVRRLHERQSLDGRAAASATRSSRCALRWRRSRLASAARGSGGVRRRLVTAPSRRLRKISRAAEPGPLGHAERLPRLARYVTDIREPGRRLDESERRHAGIGRVEIRDVRLRIERPARPIRAASGGPNGHCGNRPVDAAHNWRVEHGAVLVHLHVLERQLPELGSEVDEIVFRDGLTRVRRRLRRKRLRRRVPLARHVPLRNRTLVDRPDRLAGDPIEDVQECFLAG